VRQRHSRPASTGGPGLRRLAFSRMLKPALLATKENNRLLTYVYLVFAVICEVIGTSTLKATQGFTQPIPTIVTLCAYFVAFYVLSLTLDTIPVGIAYAIWAGIGVVLVPLIGWYFYDQALDWPAIAGITLILVGVLLINLFSEAGKH
jgi:small multidrug resistance pump